MRCVVGGASTPAPMASRSGRRSPRQTEAAAMQPDLRQARPAGTAPRASGFFDSARETGCNDHACWAYSTRSERDAAAAEWLLEGAKLGQRPIAVTADDDAGAGLLAAITDAPGADSLQEVVHVGIDELHDLSAPIDVDAQLARYSDAVGKAIADGYRGLRVFCDITPLIADPTRHASHAHWEHVADAWMAQGNPMAALCAYDIGVIDDQAEAVMALHPLRHGPAGSCTPFGLYCRTSGPVLDGEIDAFGVPALVGALAALPDGPVDLDVSELSFLGVRAAAALEQACQSQLRLVGAPPIVHRVWQILGFDMRMLHSRRSAS
ncbi:MEDS domain-containing protein [Mycobacterium sp. IS-1556]|uniref:MEDS domain-containing protein n=1 Tax=Mycobacterium sp. IS-1556 TaxID=1772276 RepID=UPI0009E84A00